MPIASNGIYELRLRTDRAGQDLYNVFHFLDTTGLDTHAQDLADTWKIAKTAFIRDLLSSAVTFVDILCFPVFGTGIEVTVPYTGGETGNRVGESMPSYVATSLKYQRSSRETGSGWKRFGPMTEPDVVGDFFEAVYLSFMDNAAAALEGAVVGVSATYEPIIFRAANTAKDPLPRYQLISSVNALNRVTTQTSRKRFV
jgi:hypothetical protein